MSFYLFDEHTIIASNDEIEARTLYKKEYGDEDYDRVQEIDDDYVVGGIQLVSGDGYGEVLLHQVVDKGKKLPYIVHVDLF